MNSKGSYCCAGNHGVIYLVLDNSKAVRMGNNSLLYEIPMFLSKEPDSQGFLGECYLLPSKGYRTMFGYAFITGL